MRPFKVMGSELVQPPIVSICHVKHLIISAHPSHHTWLFGSVCAFHVRFYNFIMYQYPRYTLVVAELTMSENI